MKTIIEIIQSQSITVSLLCAALLYLLWKSEFTFRYPRSKRQKHSNRPKQ